MTNRKGKIPSLLSMTTGKPVPHVSGRKTPCGLCEEPILMGVACFEIPKKGNGFTSRPLHCVPCVKLILEQTKKELEKLIGEVSVAPPV